MPETFVLPRSFKILALCVPLAALVGYLLADPLRPQSLAVVILVMAVISLPLLMRWHHPMLIISWNAAISPYFIPGSPYLWMIMSAACLFFAIINRAVDPDRRFLSAPSVTGSLLFFAAVVAITAITTGGIGVRVLGSESYGGRGYFYLWAAVFGYFALISRPIPGGQARLIVSLFFLSGITAVIGNLAVAAGPGFYFLFDLFPPELALEHASAQQSVTKELVRFTGLLGGSLAVFCCLLANYGIRGVLDIRKPWRLALLLITVAAGFFCGFRSVVVIFVLTFGVLFWFEGLFRTRLFPILIGLSVLGFMAILPLGPKLPSAVQRTLSFLPIEVDPVVRYGATASTEWRLEMWNVLVPDVPKYLLKGKGYAINPAELHLAQEAATRGSGSTMDLAIIAGDYHNGPLSVVIPFGIFGVIGFAWFMAASIRAMHKNYKFSPPSMLLINRFLLAYFVARVLFFIVFFGALSTELFVFTGLVGLSLSLNGGVRKQPVSMASDTQEGDIPQYLIANRVQS